MKYVLWILIASVFVSSSAEANVRAPISEDGDVVIAKLAREATASITLTKQRLVVRLPRLVEKEFSSLHAEIQATYTFQNDGAAVTVPMVFLATGIHDATVAINGTKASAPTTGEMNDAQRAELSKAVGTYAPARRANKPVAGSTATFELRLEPGENIVTFTYAQSTRFDEGGTRYGGPTYERSKMVLTYLLYPCRAWKKADDFALDVAVIVPDYTEDGWFWDTYWAPSVVVNLSLTPAYDKTAHQTTFSGQFSTYPDDVLNVAIERGKKR